MLSEGGGETKWLEIVFFKGGILCGQGKKTVLLMKTALGMGEFAWGRKGGGRNSTGGHQALFAWFRNARGKGD